MHEFICSKYSGLNYYPIHSIERGKMLCCKFYISVENLIKTARRLKIKMTGLIAVLFRVKLNNLVLRMLRVSFKNPKSSLWPEQKANFCLQFFTH